MLDDRIKVRDIVEVGSTNVQQKVVHFSLLMKAGTNRRFVDGYSAPIQDILKQRFCLNRFQCRVTLSPTKSVYFTVPRGNKPMLVDVSVFLTTRVTHCNAIKSPQHTWVLQYAVATAYLTIPQQPSHSIF